jgi:serine/threonine-protein kinase
VKPAPGVTISDRLELARPLGKGGMGSVWAARHATLDADVAVKFVAPELALSDNLRERLAREAKMAAQIKSPHIVQTFDQGFTDDGTAYIVMELLEGESLGERLRRDGPLPVQTVALVVEQIARVLATAHGAGIVHRDIKPDNVFLVRQEDVDDIFVKVLDFGIARSLESEHRPLTQSGATIGTVAYMSPEQLDDSRSAGPSTDAWALAVVAYECLTGMRPFRGDSAVALWKAIQESEFAPPSSTGAGVSKAFDPWFARAFAVKPEDRFESARALAEAFRRACREGDIAHAPTVAEDLALARTEASTGAERRPAKPRRKRDPMQLFLTVLVVILVIGGLLVTALVALEKR